MFKKWVEAKSQQRLSGADRKKLKRSIKERFSSASDIQIDILIPPKVEITVAKYPNRILVYSLEGGAPMFLMLTAEDQRSFRQEFVHYIHCRPEQERFIVLWSCLQRMDSSIGFNANIVFALWKVPELLPAFVLKGGEVSRFVIGGADLMFPGISINSEGLPNFLAGEPWAVKVPGNPAPIAVGTTLTSSIEALKAGLRGKALKICHYYRDSLWDSAEGRYVPNAGFFEDAVFEDPSFSSTCQSSDLSHVESSIDQEATINDKEQGGAVGYTDAVSTIQSDSNSDEQLAAAVSDLKVSENVSDNQIIEEEQHTLSTEEIDVLLDKCLLQALLTTIKDKDLPMAGSTLWSNHVLPCRPSGITLDIRKSSHKKLSKWLQSKSSGGLISIKEDKHKKEVMLLSVNRKHADYISFKPEKQQLEKKEQPADVAPNEGDASKKTLEVAEIYKPSVHVIPIFEAVGANSKMLFSASEASDVVFKYVEKENLVKPADRSLVVLDATLCDALFKGSIKKGSTYPTEIHKKDLGTTFVNRMQPHHLVTRGAEAAVRKGALKPLQIMTERRQGNKKVTKLSGLESFLIDADALAPELQKKFACSTSVTELPGKKGFEVLVQGGVIDVLARYLVEQYGIPKRYIEVLDKTRK